MTGEGRQEAAGEELAAAREELAAAGQLLDGGFPRIASTRLYFAAFHAVRALLYSQDLEPRTHRGVQHLFNVHFVRAERFAAADARLLARLQKYREEADYGLAFPADEGSGREELEKVRRLVGRVEAAIVTESGG